MHAEVCPDLPAIARRMRALGIRAAIAINPETPVDRVIAAAAHFDMILVMSVHPGFGGQSFIEQTVGKVRAVREEIERRGLDVDVEIDGGIKIENIATVAAACANFVVAGSGIFGKPDYAAIIAEMRAHATHP